MLSSRKNSSPRFTASTCRRIATFEPSSPRSARQAAEELLSDTDFAARVDQLPFAAGDTVVALGDSITDDLQSWAEILRHLLDLRRSGDQIQVVNQGISGDTTAAALRRIVPILLTQRSWIICMLGTNDVQRNGLQATKTLVSLDETALNLAELRHLAATESEAHWAWITAPPCDEELVAASPFWAQAEIIIRNDDLVAVADVLRDEPDPIVDLVTLFSQSPAAGLLWMTAFIQPAPANRRSCAHWSSA